MTGAALARRSARRGCFMIDLKFSMCDYLVKSCDTWVVPAYSLTSVTCNPLFFIRSQSRISLVSRTLAVCLRMKPLSSWGCGPVWFYEDMYLTKVTSVDEGSQDAKGYIHGSTKMASDPASPPHPGSSQRGKPLKVLTLAVSQTRTQD
jgi:hypothetical protein